MLLLAFAASAGLQPDVVSTGNSFGPAYNVTAEEIACGAHVLATRYRSSIRNPVQFDHVMIDAVPVLGAAREMERRAAGWYVQDFSILNCGWKRDNAEFHGVLRFSEVESRPGRMRSMERFTIRRVEGSWTIEWHD